MSVSLVHATPEGDALVAYIARVSNPLNQGNTATASKLIRFLIDHNHWSPFEMVSLCVEINTTRDIGRQILRHRSFSFQEFSQRYAAVEGTVERELRMKSTSNRQGSLDTREASLEAYMAQAAADAFATYQHLLDKGVAPECARSILPEGMTPTRMYMHGTLRSWLHYISERTKPGVQKEHRLIAQAINDIITTTFPNIAEAFNSGEKA